MPRGIVQTFQLQFAVPETLSCRGQACLTLEAVAAVAAAPVAVAYPGRSCAGGQVQIAKSNNIMCGIISLPPGNKIQSLFSPTAGMIR